MARTTPNDLERDADFVSLDREPVPLDALSVLGGARLERPHTHFLAWVLDGRSGSRDLRHGFGARAVEALVGAVLAAVDPLPGLGARVPRVMVGRVVEASLTVAREVAVGDGVRTKARAPDVLVTFEDARGTAWAVVIEAKVDADEGTGQVSDYLAFLDRSFPSHERLLAFVTPDGRPPRIAATDTARVASMRWATVAEALVAVLSDDSAASVFARAVLGGWIGREGGSRVVRGLVARLHAKHPREAAQRALASGGVDDDSVAGWHLRHVRPYALGWSARWAERVAAAVCAMRPSWPRVIAGAPNAGRSDCAVWTVAGLTETTSLMVVATEGKALGASRKQLWLALYAPQRTVDEVFDERDQRAMVAMLPSHLGEALRGAVPVMEAADRWRWLRVGEARGLPPTFDLDDVSAVANAVTEVVGPWVEALSGWMRDAGNTLYAIDLDGDAVFPRDESDRRALVAGRVAGGDHVLIVEPDWAAAPGDLRSSATLGATLSAAFGGAGTLSFDHGPTHRVAPTERATVVLVDLADFALVPTAKTAETVAMVEAALGAGAALWLVGDRAEVARWHLPASLARFTPPTVLHASAGPVRWAVEGVSVVGYFFSAGEALGQFRLQPDGCIAWWRAMLAA